MAKRRCISLEIIDTDKFLDMPASTQALYMHLLCRADDDGFVGNPKRILRMLNFSIDDLNLLCMKEFIIPFESGVIVITDWNSQNTLKNDRYKPTKYTEEKSSLGVDENKRYFFNNFFNKIGNGNSF